MTSWSSPDRVARTGIRLLAVLVLSLGSACSMVPDYQRPDEAIPAAYRTAVPEPAADLPRPLSRWWTAFGSAELDALVEEALANNHDVKAATQRIAQAQAQAGSAGSALLPSVGLSASRSVDAPTGGKGTIVSGSTNRAHRLSSVGLTVSYELDLWGKIRASEDSALATVLANVHDREAVSVTMVSDLVLAYLTYLQTLDREAVAQNTVATMRSVQDGIRERIRLGESSELELAQQRNLLAQAEADIPPLRLARDHAFNRIAILVGRAPGNLTLTGGSLAALTVPEVAPGLPSELLLRRPDIRKAEAALIAANADIGVARAKMLPSLSLTGERGWASQLFDTLSSPGSIYYTVAANLAATLFDNGKSQAEIDYRRARHAELAEAYRQAVLAGLRDVEDALAEIRRQNEIEIAQREVLSASQTAYALSSEAFLMGMVDFLSVLDTQRVRFQAEDMAVQARSSRLAAAVLLFKALGGGTTPEEGNAVATEPATAAPPSPPPG